MGWDDFVLSQDTVNRAPKARPLGAFRGVAKDVVYCEVGADTVADLEVFDRIGDADDLAGAIRAWDNALSRARGVLTVGNHQVAVL